MSVDMRWKENTCPICDRTFTVAPADDYLIPACGCFNDAEPGHYPCELCGIKHFYEHKGGEAPTKRIVAIEQDGEVIAYAEGEMGDALADEFVVRPEKGEA